MIPVRDSHEHMTERSKRGDIALALRIVRDRFAHATGLRIGRAALNTWIDDRVVALLKRRVQKRTKLVVEKELQAVYQKALALLVERNGRSNIGDYLEFGVYNGTSMLCMYRALENLRLEDVRLFGFDSFEGLPPDAGDTDGGVWRPGDFKSSFEFTQTVLSLSGINWGRLRLVKGWFSDTLNEDLVRNQLIEKASVVMIDCDLYTAAREALQFCRPLIKDETIFIFDDWHAYGLDGRGMGEKRAFEEFMQNCPELSSSHLKGLSGYNNRRPVPGGELFLVTRLRR
jgi:O-methyltransferase